MAGHDPRFPRRRTPFSGWLEMYAVDLPNSAAADFEMAEHLLAGLEHRVTPSEAEFGRLMLAIRATATASLSEGEWVRRIRGAGFPIVPHWSGDDAVTGYGLERATRQDAADAGRPAILLDGYLPWDLQLPALRQQWDCRDDAHAQALIQWQVMRSSRSFDREAVELADCSLWRRAFDDVRQFNEYLRAVPVENRSEWARAASRVAGVLALWARRPGCPASDLMAAAATQLGRSAQMTATSMSRPISENGVLAPDLSLPAIVLAQLNTDFPDPPSVSLGLLMELLTSIVMIAKAHRRRGEIPRANSLIVGTCNPLNGICRALHVLAHDDPPSPEDGQDR